MSEFGPVWMPYTDTGRVVLDQKSFKKENYLAGVSISAVDVCDKSMRMLCPPHTFGYSLARKDWCRFYIDNISPITWNKSALDKLALDEKGKHVLKALVSSHTYPSQVRDETQQKGKGLVMLLHGSPGSGKTLTAGLPKNEINLNIEEEADQFAGEDINGREIANCINTAGTLARFEGMKLGVAHIRTMLMTKEEFEKNLKSMRSRRKNTEISGLEIPQISRKNTLEEDED